MNTSQKSTEESTFFLKLDATSASLSNSVKLWKCSSCPFLKTKTSRNIATPMKENTRIAKHKCHFRRAHIFTAGLSAEHSKVEIDGQISLLERLIEFPTDCRRKVPILSLEVDVNNFTISNWRIT